MSKFNPYSQNLRFHNFFDALLLLLEINIHFVVYLYKYGNSCIHKKLTKLYYLK